MQIAPDDGRLLPRRRRPPAARAMGKKKATEMDKQRKAIFIEGATARGHTP